MLPVISEVATHKKHSKYLQNFPKIRKQPPEVSCENICS